MDVQVPFRRLFYGLLLVFFDFRIGFFDILPDFIGYWLIVSALTKLSEYQGLFSKARIFAVFLFFVSFGDLFKESNTNINTLVPTEVILQSLVIIAFAGIFRLFMVYYVCEGIRELALPHNPDFAVLTKRRRNVFLTVNYLALFLEPFSLNVSSQMVTLGMLLLIPAFIAEILFMALIYRAGREMGPGRFENTPV